MTPHLLAQGIPIMNPAINNSIGIFANVSNGPGVVEKLLGIIINAAFAFAGLYFLFNLLRGGYEFISAGGDKDSVQSARKRIVNAMVGIIIILSAYAILFIVETLFGISIRNFNIPNV